jgi:hypothetical protein
MLKIDTNEIPQMSSQSRKFVQICGQFWKCTYALDESTRRTTTGKTIAQFKDLML